MQPLFKDEATQKAFERDGFVKLPALDENQIQELLEFYNTLELEYDKNYGFHISMDAEDKGLVSRTMDKIYDVALPSILPHFKDAKAYICSFVIKEPGPRSIVPIHQDWTFVEDETSHNSVTFWIPLVDVSMDNGALGVVKGSHRFFDQIRPSPSPQIKTPLQDHMFAVFPYVDIIELKAGEGLIFDNRTFHASPPNITDQTRVAIGIGLTQKEAQLCHYFMKPDGTQKNVLKYKVDESFFRKYDNSRLSKMYDSQMVVDDYELLETAPYHVQDLTSEELVEMIGKAGNQLNPILMTRLAKLFNYNMDGSPKEESSVSEEVHKEDTKKNDLPFWKVYTPINIVREILYRLGIIR